MSECVSVCLCVWVGLLLSGECVCMCLYLLSWDTKTRDVEAHLLLEPSKTFQNLPEHGGSL